MKSNCCLSTLITRSSDEGTSYYECKACGEPCDVAPQNQPPLDTGHHAEYDYKKNQTKGEVCGCEADEQGIEHTTDAHTPSKPVGEWEEEMKTYLTSAGDRRRVIDFIKTRFISKTEHEKKIREAEILAWENGYQCGFFKLDIEKSRSDYLFQLKGEKK